MPKKKPAQKKREKPFWKRGLNPITMWKPIKARNEFNRSSYNKLPTIDDVETNTTIQTIANYNDLIKTYK